MEGLSKEFTTNVKIWVVEGCGWNILKLKAYPNLDNIEL